MTARFEMLQVLHDDVMRAFDEFYAKDDEYNRRMVVRAFASAVEGETTHIKQVCIDRIDREPTLYSSGEVALLLEESYYLADDASVTRRPHFLRVADNFHFAMKAFVKDTMPELDLRSDEDGWTNFKNAFRIRNRVTHPRNNEDLEIADADLACVQHAYIWFRRVGMKTLIESHIVLHDQYDSQRETIKEAGKDPGPPLARVIPRDELSKTLDKISKHNEI